MSDFLTHMSNIERALYIGEPSLALYGIYECLCYYHSIVYLGNASAVRVNADSPLTGPFNRILSIALGDPNRYHAARIKKSPLPPIDTLLADALAAEPREPLDIAQAIALAHATMFGECSLDDLLERVTGELGDLLAEIVTTPQESRGIWPQDYHISTGTYYLSPRHSTPLDVDLSDPAAYGVSGHAAPLQNAPYYRITNKHGLRSIGDFFLYRRNCAVVDFSECGLVEEIGDFFMCSCTHYGPVLIGPAASTHNLLTGLLRVKRYGLRPFFGCADLKLPHPEESFLFVEQGGESPFLSCYETKLKSPALSLADLPRIARNNQTYDALLKGIERDLDIQDRLSHYHP